LGLRGPFTSCLPGGCSTLRASSITAGNCPVFAGRKEIKLPAETLAAYAGNYDAGIAKVVVTFEDGHLMMQFGPQPKAELFAESVTSFFLKIVDAQIEFTKDTSGAVTGLTLHQGPRDLKAERK
jgi:hypothetical protein